MEIKGFLYPSMSATKLIDKMKIGMNKIKLIKK